MTVMSKSVSTTEKRKRSSETVHTRAKRRNGRHERTTSSGEWLTEGHAIILSRLHSSNATTRPPVSVPSTQMSVASPQGAVPRPQEKRTPVHLPLRALQSLPCTEDAPCSSITRRHHASTPRKRRRKPRILHPRHRKTFKKDLPRIRRGQEWSSSDAP